MGYVEDVIGVMDFAKAVLSGESALVEAPTRECCLLLDLEPGARQSSCRRTIGNAGEALEWVYRNGPITADRIKAGLYLGKSRVGIQLNELMYALGL